MQRLTSCLCHILWQSSACPGMAHPIRAGQDTQPTGSTPQAASNGARLCSHPHLHMIHAPWRTRSSKCGKGHGQRTRLAQQEHTHTHTCTHAHAVQLMQQQDAPAPHCLPNPGRVHTLMHSHAHRCTHINIYMQMDTHTYIHTHLHTTTPICKCRHGHSCLSSAPPAPCPPHANPPCAKLHHANPQPGSPGPQRHANGHAGPRGWGDSTAQRRQQHPAAPCPLPAWHSP